MEAGEYAGGWHPARWEVRSLDAGGAVTQRRGVHDKEVVVLAAQKDALRERILLAADADRRAIAGDNLCRLLEEVALP